MPWIVQCLDHEEGSAARWFDLKRGVFPSQIEARQYARKHRESAGEDCMWSYRVVEVGSKEYYSQPTDAFEY